MGLPTIFYDNRFADAIPTASSTAAGFAAANINDLRPYTFHKPTAMPVSYTVDTATAKAADYALIYGHDLFTQSAAVEVRGSTDNFVGSNVLLASFTPTSNLPFILSFTTANYRYRRIIFTGATATTTAMILCGTALPMPTQVLYGFDPIARRVVADQNVNENGFPLGKIIQYESWKQQLRFNNIDDSWIRSTFLPAWKAHLRGNPFLFAVDPILYPNEIYLVTAGSEVNFDTSIPNKSNIIFDISGVAL